jgi:Zn-dependent protease with chaperone function
MFSVGLWASSYFFLVLGACYLLFLVAALSMRKRARRMEERADAFGKEAESEAGVYPRALAKLYEENLIPAVMPGKRQAHPHLYDRLLAAGITPDYPRPKPPGRWGIVAGVAAIAIHGACLWALWFCLF